MFMHENAFKNVVYEMAAILSQPQCVKNVSYHMLHIKAIEIFMVPCGNDAPELQIARPVFRNSWAYCIIQRVLAHNGMLSWST